VGSAARRVAVVAVLVVVGAALGQVLPSADDSSTPPPWPDVTADSASRPGPGPDPASPSPTDLPGGVSFRACPYTAPPEGTTHLAPPSTVAAVAGTGDGDPGVPGGKVRLVRATTLRLDDGLLRAGSGYEAMAGSPMEEAPATHVWDGTVDAPVTLALLDSPTAGVRVAFAEVQLAPAPPVLWTHAPDLGIGTDGGDGGFYRTGLLTSVDMSGEWIDPYVEAYGDTGNCVLRIGAMGDVESVMFTTGYGDGGYPTFLGRDADGRVVSVVHVGWILPWEDSGLPGPEPDGLEF
jgi:hypothetical protein